MPESLAQKAYNFFLSRGYTSNQAAGIVGNLQVESNLSTTIKGDGGKAIGLAQWHPDRQANFANVFKKNIQDATFWEQLSFVDWELKNTETNALFRLRENSATVDDAAKAFAKYYERPANSSSYGRRIEEAKKVINNYSPPSIWERAREAATNAMRQVPIPGAGGVTTGGATNAAGAAQAASEEAANWIVGWIPRFVAMLIGGGLILIAIIVLIGGDKVIEVTKDAVSGQLG